MTMLDVNAFAARKFKELDANNSGTLEHDELLTLTGWLVSEYDNHDENSTAEEMERTRVMMMDRIDCNKDGVLDLGEFMALAHEVYARRKAMLRATEKFYELDNNGNGILEHEEIDAVVDYVLKKFQPDGIAPLAADAVATFKAEMMAKVDTNNDGKLSLKEFSQIFDDMYTSHTALIVPHAKAI